MKKSLCSMACCGLMVAGRGVLAQEAAGSSVGVESGRIAPINDYKGMQEREEIFAFAKKPEVRSQKAGGKHTWVVSFETTARCDATVTVLGPDGKVVRRLASGVLGANAPYPFQQDSLSQKVEWDGLTDMFQKAPEGCKVKVSLGLQAKFDRNLIYDHYDMAVPDGRGIRNNHRLAQAEGPDGSRHLVSILYSSVIGKVYDKEGKYVRTFLPPPAADLEKVATAIGRKMLLTQWGDKVIVPFGSGPWSFDSKWLEQDKPDYPLMLDKIAGLDGFQMLGKAKTPTDPKQLKDESRPEWLPPAKNERVGMFESKLIHLAVDPVREELYAGYGVPHRIDTATGERFKLPNCPDIFEHAIGPDGLLYTLAQRGGWLMRLDREGKDVPFSKENAVVIPAKDAAYRRMTPGITAVLSGMPLATSGCMKAGLCVSPAGIVCGASELPKGFCITNGLQVVGTDQSYVFVWDLDGKLRTVNAIGSLMAAQGVTMDRDGSIYLAYTGLPEGQKVLDGLDISAAGSLSAFGPGTLIKYRGLGGKFPLGVGPGKVKFGGKELPGSLWSYNGIVRQTGRNCSCSHVRFVMDGWARNWIPANHLYSITVLDANGNRIARLGRYGNVDDTEADLKAGRDGLRFCWPRGVAASDNFLYVWDFGNRRVLKAALSYAAEETVQVR